MQAFQVPRYLNETAARHAGVRDWIAKLPAVVANLAGRWELRVGEPFEPGGQCSWTAPAVDRAGRDLVLKVAFRFPGGEERDEAAGLRVWNGHGTVRLYAAEANESAYALLMERCVPGTPLGRLRPEQIVALTAFGGLMVATNLFNNALQVDLDEYLHRYRKEEKP